MPDHFSSDRPTDGVRSDAVARSEQVDRDDWLQRMRHSAAHVLAQIMLERFPDAKLAIGPPISTGFYYDFLLPRTLTPDDLTVIEQRMHEEIAKAHAFYWEEVPVSTARDRFQSQPFKQELIDEFSQDSDQLGLCTHAGFTDLCRGGHVTSTDEIGPFRLTNISGAYWRGDEHNPQLQRVYGALFATSEELEAHFTRLEEAQRRDHRRIGRDLGLFTFHEDVGAGIPLFLPKGAIIRHEMENFIRELQEARGYQEVWTGHLAKRELFQRSGHLENYADAMFPGMVDENTEYFLKPMNCPLHMTLYNQSLHSYRDLPLRYAEYATLYRYEKSGQLGGLTRVRALTQDDCHIFLTLDQIEAEFGRVVELVRTLLETYGLADFRFQLSLPGADGKYVDNPDAWETSINALRTAMDAQGIAYVEQEGEATFYGPKADLFVKDVLDREWQLSTIQIDFIQPQRLGCVYVGEDGARHTPVVMHRAIHGSLERFLGILIEHYAGAFPAWLAPVQARIIPIADRHLAYAEDTAARLRAARLRVDVDAGNERLNAKIRSAQLEKIPYMLVVGDREIEAEAVAVRTRGGEKRGAMPIPEFEAALLAEVRERRL